MKKISLKKGILLFYAFDALLLVILIAAVLPLANKRSVAEKSLSALLNVNYAPDVDTIYISTPGTSGRESVTLYKTGSVWSGTDSASGDKISWPVQPQNVARLMEKATELVSLEAKAGTLDSWEKLGVDEEHCIQLTFLSSGSNILSSLYFGQQDSLSSTIAVRTWKGKTVYSAPDSIATYLNAQTSFWCDTSVYPQCVTSYSAAKTQQFLRRGVLTDLFPAAHLEPSATIRKIFESGAEAYLAAYQKDSEYIIIPVFKASPACTPQEKSVIESFNYRYSVSDWTFNKLLEEQ